MKDKTFMGWPAPVAIGLAIVAALVLVWLLTDGALQTPGGAQ